MEVQGAAAGLQLWLGKGRCWGSALQAQVAQVVVVPAGNQPGRWLQQQQGQEVPCSHDWRHSGAESC